MPENEPESPSEGGLKARLKRLEGPGEGPEGIEGSKTMETEGEEEDPKQGAVNLLLEGKSSVAEIAAQTGLPASVVGGLKGQLLKKGYLQSEKTEGGSRVELKKPSSPEDEMRQEMLSVLKEELGMTPGIGEQGLAYILKRFASDVDLGLDPNKLHFMIARHAPRMDDFDVKDVVERVFKVTETYHLDRLRGMRQFPGYRTGSRSNTGFPGYNGGPQMYPGFGPQEQRFYTDTDFSNERRLWNIDKRQDDMERRQDEIYKLVEKSNETQDKILERLEKPQSPSADSEGVKGLKDEVKGLKDELEKRDKETVRNELSSIKEDVKGLRSNLGQWKTDEFKLIGEGFGKLTDFGREVLKEAPLSKAAQNVATAMMPQGAQREVPAEARETVLSILKKEGMTVPE